MEEIARVYANALFEAAKDRGKLDAIHEQLAQFADAISENRDMQVWLAPVEGARVLVPLRIAVATMVGPSLVEATRWTLESGDKPVPAAARRAETR